MVYCCYQYFLENELETGQNKFALLSRQVVTLHGAGSLGSSALWALGDAGGRVMPCTRTVFTDYKYLQIIILVDLKTAMRNVL